MDKAARTKEFLAGFACALADVNRLCDEPTGCANALQGAGLTLADFIDAGIDEYDLAELRKIIREGGGSRADQARLRGRRKRSA